MARRALRGNSRGLTVELCMGSEKWELIMAEAGNVDGASGLA